MLGRLEDPQIEDLLRTAAIGRIGCRDDDSVYVVPISFVFDNGCVYERSAEGRKLTLMRAAPDVCFEVEDVRGLSDWRSVVARGRFEELHGDDARAALGLLTSRFAVPMSQPHRVGPATATAQAGLRCCSASGCSRAPDASSPPAFPSDHRRAAQPPGCTARRRRSASLAMPPEDVRTSAGGPGPTPPPLPRLPSSCGPRRRRAPEARRRCGARAG